MVQKFKKKINKILCFDLDGIICNTYKNNYKLSKPIKKNIKKINSLYDQGYKIIVFTARYMGRSNENINLAHRKGFTKTNNQLKRWGLKFHQLRFGKPSYNLIIDDKGIFFNKNWANKIDNYL